MPAGYVSGPRVTRRCAVMPRAFAERLGDAPRRCTGAGNATHREDIPWLVVPDPPKIRH